MKISRLVIDAIGGIRNIELTFNPNMNIICGPNGVGKSTILDSIALLFARGAGSRLTKHVSYESGSLRSTLIHDGIEFERAATVTRYDPSAQLDFFWDSKAEHTKYLLFSKTNRIFDYTALNSIARDAVKNDQQMWEDSKSGVPTHDIKNWFVFRFLYSKHENTLSQTQLDNYALAKQCFSALNKDYSFARVDGSSNDIMLNTPNGEIHYEYLSSGFKSCISILFGIIKEIEYRFTEPRTSAKDYNGIILIDELELHLHPEWQSLIAITLTSIFPSAQFIVTTHSPHIIQAADSSQIIALEHTDGATHQRVLPSSSEGFKGWTLDEVLTDLMGMNDTRSQYFIDLIANFGQAIDNDDLASAKEHFKKLDAALHPTNPSRKLLRIQLASINGGEDDKA